MKTVCGRGHLMSETRKKRSSGDFYCSACHDIRVKIFREKYPERAKQYNKVSRLRNSYGIELSSAMEMIKNQDGKCAICRLILSSRWNVDHNHETGQIRGILCGNCNTALGLLKENAEVIRRCIEYIEGNVRYAAI